MGICILVLWRRWKDLPLLLSVSTPSLRTAFALLALAVLTTPFSVLPGNSVSFLLTQLPVVAATMIVAAKLTSSGWQYARKILYTLVISGAVLALFAVSGFKGGRASASATYDTNDLAYLLVSVLPLALGFAISGETRARRTLHALSAGLIALAILLTSSRGGFLGLVAVSAVVVLFPVQPPESKNGISKTRNRIFATLVAIAGISALVWPFLPDETKLHLSTLLSLQSDYNMDTSNSQSRSSIWERNFSAALERPIGYGVDSFLFVDAKTGGRYRAPHNSYLQILVELGFLGLLLFVRLYLQSWRALARVRTVLLSVPSSAQRNQALVFARMLQAGLAGNAVAAFFLSMAYSTTLWTFLGLIIGYSSFVHSMELTSSNNATEPKPLAANAP